MSARKVNGAGPAREWVTFADPVDEGRTWQIDVTFLLSNWQCIFGQGCQGIWTEPTPELVHGCCTYGAHFSDKADRDHVVKAARELSADEWQFAKAGRKKGIFERAEEEDDDEERGPKEWKTRRGEGRLHLPQPARLRRRAWLRVAPAHAQRPVVTSASTSPRCAGSCRCGASTTSRTTAP